MRRTDPEDTKKRYFRSQERLFSMNGQWYFTTREGEIGPFRTREGALQESSRYVREREDLESFQKARLNHIGHSDDLALEILPKDEEPDLTLDDLIMENQR